MKMSAELDETKEEVTQELTKVFDYFGFNTTVVKIYTTLFFSNRPLGLDELSEKTGYSKSMVCTTMDLVERFFDVRRFKKAGSKKVYYKCLYEPHIIVEKRVRGLHEATHSLTRALERAEKRLSATATHKQHLKNIRIFKQNFQKIDEALNTLPDNKDWMILPQQE